MGFVMNTHKLLALLVVPSLLSCGPKLTLDGSGVRVATEAAADCQPISTVEATAPCEKDAEILLRNKAGAMNANLVVVQDRAEAGGEHRLKGETYSCKEP
jgi:hypothetical protein